MPERFMICMVCWFSVSLFSIDSYADVFDFRETRWGMTRLEVMASEGKAPVSLQEPYLYYRPDVLGREFHLIYEFIENKLVEAVYIVVTRGAGDYRKIMAMIERKYGAPATREDTGNLSYRFVWKNASTTIVMRPGRLRECRIEYYGSKYRYLKEESVKKARNEYLQNLLHAF